MANNQAVITRRMYQGRAVWGFDAPEGFAPFEPCEGDLDDVTRAAARYNEGDKHWEFASIEECPLVDARAEGRQA